MATAVILAAGSSGRIRETLHLIEDPKIRKMAAESQKGMIPINRRPFLDYQLENLRKAEYRDVCFVINRETGDRIRFVYGNDFKGLKIGYAYQDKPLGQAHAILCAEEVVGASPFVALNSNNLYSPRSLSRLLEAPEGEWATIAFDADGLLQGNKHQEVPEKVREWSVLELFPEGQDLEGGILHVRKRHEKPSNPVDFAYNGRILVGVTCGLYDNRFFDIARELQKRFEMGEINDSEMRSAYVQSMAIDNGIPIRAFYANEWVPDLTTCADIPVLEERLKKFAWYLPESRYAGQE